MPGGGPGGVARIGPARIQSRGVFELAALQKAYREKFVPLGGGARIGPARIQSGARVGARPHTKPGALGMTQRQNNACF